MKREYHLRSFSLARLFAALSAALFLMVSLPARSELTIQVVRGNDKAVPVAVIPFAWQGEGLLPEDVAGIITNDLRVSGDFAPLPDSQFLGYPSSAADVHFSDWRRLGVNWLVVGRIVPGDAGYKIRYELLDVRSGQSVVQRQIQDGRRRLRSLAHRISNAVYKEITGIRGPFTSHIAYVKEEKVEGQRRRYQLMYADMDGHNAASLLRSGQPLLAPSWSPDGTRLAYVSFESGNSVVYVHNLASGQREAVSQFAGVNNAPRWSPDGRLLALALSKGGSSDIYLLNSKTGQLQQLTRHFAVDSEPAWTPDGRQLIFSSNRGGSIQLYRMNLDPGATAMRLSFTGTFNARAQIFPDGDNMVMVHKGEGEGGYSIAVQNLASGRVRVLTAAPGLQDAPSLAPNGRMVVYSDRVGTRSVVRMVSVNGRSQFTLPLGDAGADVYEPAWSPFLQAEP